MPWTAEELAEMKAADEEIETSFHMTQEEWRKSQELEVAAQQEVEGREKELSKRRARYLKNREKILAKRRLYYAANRERIKAQNRAYRQAHRERKPTRDSGFIIGKIKKKSKRIEKCTGRKTRRNLRRTTEDMKKCTGRSLGRSNGLDAGGRRRNSSLEGRARLPDLPPMRGEVERVGGRFGRKSVCLPDLRVEKEEGICCGSPSRRTCRREWLRA